MLFRRKTSLEREALDYALSTVFSDEIKASILFHLEKNYNFTMNGKEPLAREELIYALHDFLQAGAGLIISAFDKRLAELKSQITQ